MICGVYFGEVVPELEAVKDHMTRADVLIPLRREIPEK